MSEPTSRENVEVVRRAIGGITLAGRDPDSRAASVERLAPDAEFVEDPLFPEARTYRGRSEILSYFIEFTSQFDRYDITLEELMDAGEDLVLACLHVHGRGKGSGAEFDVRAGWVFTVRGSEIVRIRAYYDRAEAFEAVGLSD